MKESFSPCNKIGLAPMAGVGDSGFRRICRAFGADYSVSEMISAKAICHGSQKTLGLARHTPEEEPFLIQLFGSDPQSVAYAAAYISNHFSPVGIDLNMGCPAPKIFNNGEGSALMARPKLAAELVHAAVNNAHCPVSVKMRIGIHTFDESTIRFARALEEAGASFITVHGRTRDQYYSGKADYAAIAAVRASLQIPVIANGDVTDAASAQEIIEKTGAAGIMLARGALGAPYVFEDIKRGFKERGPEEHFAVCLRQLAYTVEEKGEPRGCVEFRKHMLWYLKGVPGSAPLKVRAGQAQTVANYENIIHQLIH